MLKKRQELERLQAAGRHKYAYDSDEDTEGGTWEHKLRQQEMVATQLWADELTERSKGRHHIGDFLPPDELERFMEKVSCDFYRHFSETRYIFINFARIVSSTTL